jgi:hypothetical protein
MLRIFSKVVTVDLSKCLLKEYSNKYYLNGKNRDLSNYAIAIE